MRLHRPRRPQADPALRRAAAAGRAGPGARHQAQGAAARRAARCARPQASRGDAGRAQGAAARRRDHLRLRHPRPRRGAHDERPDRGVQQRPDRADRQRGRDLRTAGLGVRRRLRRHQQPDHGRGRQAAARTRRHVQRPAGEDPHRHRSRRQTSDDPDVIDRRGHRGRGRLRGRVHALRRRPRRRSTTRRRSAEPADVVDGRARLPRRTRAAYVEEAALVAIDEGRQPPVALPPTRKAWRSHDTHPSAHGATARRPALGRRDWRPSRSSSPDAARPSDDDDRLERSSREASGFEAPDLPDAGRRSATARASSTSWPGPATPSPARTTRTTTG